MERIVSQSKNRTVSAQPTLGRRKVLLGMVGIVGMGLFGTVACATGQPDQAPADANANGGPNGGPGRGGFRMTPAPELPTTQADVTGLFISRQNAILVVGTGAFNGQFNGTRQAPNGTRQAPDPNATRAPYTGPTTQVVTNAGTKLYADVTMINLQAGQNTQGMQQKVQPVDTLDKLLGADAANGTLSAWGDKNGDQLVAKVVVYRPRQQRPQTTPTPATQ